MMSLSEFNKTFASSEHKSLGNITLQGMPSDFTVFTFPGGSSLTFGEIIAVAGDFFGVALAPICLGLSEENRRRRFMAAYTMLAQCNPQNMYQLTNVITMEGVNAMAAVASGQPESVGIDMDTLRETAVYLQVTKGTYFTLLEHNLDHFNVQAFIAFKTGFAMAMDVAVAAANEPTPELQQDKLRYAYSLLAFASHFLTDLFSSGHMRIPRAELEAQFGVSFGSLLSLFQHNEDGDEGLEVSVVNKKDKSISVWRAYGDGHLFEEDSDENQTRARQVVQVAADEVFQCFQRKQRISIHDSQVPDLLPRATENNHPPLFKMHHGKLHCRQPIENTQTPEYVELTRWRALQILTHYAKGYASKAITKQIACCHKHEASVANVSVFTKKDKKAVLKKNHEKTHTKCCGLF